MLRIFSLNFIQTKKMRRFSGDSERHFVRVRPRPKTGRSDQYSMPVYSKIHEMGFRTVSDILLHLSRFFLGAAPQNNTEKKYFYGFVKPAKNSPLSLHRSNGYLNIFIERGLVCTFIGIGMVASCKSV